MFFETLRVFRCYCGYSQEEMAKLLNIDRTTYLAYETAEKMPSPDTIDRIARIFNVNPERMVDGYREMKRFRVEQPAIAYQYGNKYNMEDEREKITDLNIEEKIIISYFRASSLASKDAIIKMVQEYYLDHDFKYDRL